MSIGRRRWRRVGGTAALVVVCSAAAGTAGVPPALPEAQFSPPIDIERTRLSDVLIHLERYSKLAPEAPPMRVGGIVELHQQAVIASEIVFGPGGRLILSPSPSESSGDIFIVTSRIVNEDSGPALIAWSRGSQPELPPSRSSAPTGPSGASEGLPGLDGSPGDRGFEGYPGGHAPNLIILTRSMTGSPIVVDLRGQDGGAGGNGQVGGRGGIGAPGQSAVSMLLGCRLSAGDGGRGGSGGRGGDGGTGGAGGKGGTVILLAEISKLPASRNLLLVDVSGGRGGRSGMPGAGGEGGQGGLPGRGDGPCAPGRNGEEGAPGPPGEAGVEGPPGEPGVFYVAGLVSSQLRRLLGHF